MTSSVRDVDRGYRKTLESIEECGKIAITIGVHAEEGGAPSGAGLTVVEVAEINEFGLGVPARPSISAWADEQGPDFVRRMRDEAANAARAKVSPAQRLDALAQVGAGMVQAKISGGVPPPNAPATIAKKGSSTPLINTGQFRSSIRGKAGSK